MGKKSASKGTPRMYLVKNALLFCLCSSEFVTPRVPPVFYLSPVSTFNTFPWRLQTRKQRQTQGNSEPEEEKKKKKSSRRRLSVTREQHSWLALRTSRICTAIRLCLLLFVREAAVMVKQPQRLFRGTFACSFPLPCHNQTVVFVVI